MNIFLEQAVLDYGETRDFPAIAGTSVLSPIWRRASSVPVSVWRCSSSALAIGPSPRLSPALSGSTNLSGARFYRHLLVLIPTLSMNRPFKPETAALPWSWDPDAFAAWCEGRTGYPIVDAAMRCLNATGWMHNRLRMIVASFLTRISISTGGSGRITS